MGPGKAPERTSTLTTRVPGCGVRQPWGALRACLQQGLWPWRRPPSTATPRTSPDLVLRSCDPGKKPASAATWPPRPPPGHSWGTLPAECPGLDSGVPAEGRQGPPGWGWWGREQTRGSWALHLAEAPRETWKRQGRRGAAAVRTSAQPRPLLPGEHRPRAEPPAAQTPRRPCGGRAAAQACGGRSVRAQLHVRS